MWVPEAKREYNKKKYKIKKCKWNEMEKRGVYKEVSK
jgi:hypothetical protein